MLWRRQGGGAGGPAHPPMAGQNKFKIDIKVLKAFLRVSRKRDGWGAVPPLAAPLSRCPSVCPYVCLYVCLCLSIGHNVVSEPSRQAEARSGGTARRRYSRTRRSLAHVLIPPSASFSSYYCPRESEDSFVFSIVAKSLFFSRFCYRDNS